MKTYLYLTREELLLLHQHWNFWEQQLLLLLQQLLPFWCLVWRRHWVCPHSPLPYCPSPHSLLPCSSPSLLPSPSPPSSFLPPRSLLKLSSYHCYQTSRTFSPQICLKFSSRVSEIYTPVYNIYTSLYYTNLYYLQFYIFQTPWVGLTAAG